METILTASPMTVGEDNLEWILEGSKYTHLGLHMDGFRRSIIVGRWEKVGKHRYLKIFGRVKLHKKC